MKRRYLTVLTALLILAGYVSLAAGESPWPMFRHDLKNTARSPYTGPATPDLVWSFQANDGIVSSPSIGHNGTIYVGSAGYYQAVGDSSFYAINPDGTLKWQFLSDSAYYGAGMFSSPAIAEDGTIFVGSADGYLYCLEDSITYGKLRWRTGFSDFAVYSSPAIGADGTVYFGVLNFTFNAFRPEDGTKKWDYTSGWCIFSSPAIDDEGVLYVGSKDHNVYAFEDSVDYGKVRWNYRAGIFYEGYLFDSSPAIGPDGTLYIGADPFGASGQPPVHIDTSFYAINPDGTLKWTYNMPGGVESSPAIGADGTIYVGSLDSCVYALEDVGSEGVLKWKFVTGGAVDASPTVDGAGVIYIGSRDSNMYAINLDGTERWRFSTEGGIESSATIDGDGNLLFGSFDGKLYALGTGATDVGVESVAIPSEVEVNATYYPAADVRNFRSSQQNFQVEFLIEESSSTVYSDTSDVSASGGGTQQVLFKPWTVDPDSGLTYSAMARTILGSDDNFINDTVFAVAVSTSSGTFICGDADGSAAIDIDDVVYVIAFIFSGGSPPSPLGAGDADCSGGIDIDDVVYLIAYIFAGGPAPCAGCP